MESQHSWRLFVLSPTKRKKEIIMPHTTPSTITITAVPSTNTTYTILSTLGKGGNGIVFLAHDQEGKSVAIKQSSDPDRDLERERTMLTMLHKAPIAGIPRLLDLILLDGEQKMGLVMEYIE